MAVIGQGYKTSFTRPVNAVFISDYSVTAGNNGRLTAARRFPSSREHPGRSMSEIRSGKAKVAGKSVLVTGVDANVTKAST